MIIVINANPKRSLISVFIYDYINKLYWKQNNKYNFQFFKAGRIYNLL